jgi:hypothetical protein
MVYTETPEQFYSNCYNAMIVFNFRERKDKLKPQGGITFKEKYKKLDREYFEEMQKRDLDEKTEESERKKTIVNGNLVAEQWSVKS